MPQSRRPVPFPDHERARAFNSKFQEVAARLLRHAVDVRLPPENSQTFYHGGGWTQQRADGSEMTMAVKAHTAETLLPFEDVIDGKLSAVAVQIRSIIEQMEGSFMRTLYETISEAAEEAGNVVSGKGKPKPETILEALRKIEFGVNRKGEVTRPEIHLHPDQVPEFVKAVEEAGPELQAEIDRVTAEKEAAALAREAERKGRFKKRIDAQ